MIQIILLSQHVLAAGQDETDLASNQRLLERVLSPFLLKFSPLFFLAFPSTVDILLALLVRDAIAVKDSTWG